MVIMRGSSTTTTSSLSSLTAVVGIVLVASCLGIPAGWKNHTVYRVTPINYTGITNMDSGDAKGDVMFGLSQLLLPVLCPSAPDFTWCANRQYLSDGSAHMVYSEFVIAADPRMGDYAACNPNSTTGKFQCEHYGGGGSNVPVPAQCKKGFEMYHNDCLNGTVYDSLPNTDEGGCCAACTKDGAKCLGWNLLKKAGTCQLMTAPLVQWDSGQATGSCTSAEVSEGSTSSNCWYEDPTYNTTFNGACDRSKCDCDAIENLAMGYEPGAMCHHHGNSSDSRNKRSRALDQLARRWAARQPAWLGRPADPPTAITSALPGKEAKQPTFWACAAAAYDLCYETLASPSGPDTPACEGCMAKHAPALAARGLDCSAYVGKGADAPKTGVCAPSAEACSAVVAYKCGAAPALANETYTCTDCAFEEANVEALANAGCNASWANQACLGQGGGGFWPDTRWTYYVFDLGCKMDGTWYSNQEQGQCTDHMLARSQHASSTFSSVADAQPCWWKLAETKRTVNQTCVDGRVVAAVRAHRPKCWSACPQPNNATTPCYLDCLFTTMLGNASLGVLPMTTESIVAPFVEAFSGDGKGCPSVAPTPGATWAQ